MKTLMILRHAKSSWEHPDRRDFDRALNDRGHQNAPVVASAMQDMGLVFDLCLCSSARRTCQTLEHVLSVYSDYDGPVQYLDALYLADFETLLRHIRNISADISNVLIVGHNPGMHELVVRLAEPNHDMKDIYTKFPTMALAVLKIDIDRWDQIDLGPAQLQHYVTPKRLTKKKDSPVRNIGRSEAE